MHYDSCPLGHTKIETTVRYLGIEVDDALGDFGTNRCLINLGRADTLCPSLYRRVTSHLEIIGRQYCRATTQELPPLVPARER